jgi:hypothetical protein
MRSAFRRSGATKSDAVQREKLGFERCPTAHSHQPMKMKAWVA